MPTGKHLMIKLQPDVFQHDLIQVGLWRIVKVQPLRDMDMMKISLLWTGCPDWSGAGVGSSEPGFHVRGTVPKCKKCMGTLNPRCFPAAHGSCPTLKFLSKSMRLRSLGGMHQPQSWNTQYKKSTYLQSFFRLVVIIHTQSCLAESSRTAIPWSADV